MTERFGLYLILTEPVAGYEKAAEAAVARGVRYLQLRMKRESRDRVLRMARRLRDITRGTATRFIVNDDVEVAREADADGVHLGQGDLSLPEARRRWPESGRIFGLSTHNAEQARRAEDWKPDYIGVGPVFPTPTKEKPDPVLGLERLEAIVRSSPLTTVAIGGIDAVTLPDVLRRGVRNFCVVRAVNASPDPGRAIGDLQAIWRNEFHVSGSTFQVPLET